MTPLVNFRDSACLLRTHFCSVLGSLEGPSFSSSVMNPKATESLPTLIMKLKMALRLLFVLNNNLALDLKNDPDALIPSDTSIQAADDFFSYLLSNREFVVLNAFGNQISSEHNSYAYTYGINLLDKNCELVPKFTKLIGVSVQGVDNSIVGDSCKLSTEGPYLDSFPVYELNQGKSLSQLTSNASPEVEVGWAVEELCCNMDRERWDRILCTPDVIKTILGDNLDGCNVFKIRVDNLSTGFQVQYLINGETKTRQISPNRRCDYISGEIADEIIVEISRNDDNNDPVRISLASPIECIVLDNFTDMNVRFELKPLLVRITDGNNIIVSNGNDSGEGSLRDAIMNASFGDCIAISPEVEVVNLASSILVNKTLSIKGNNVIIDAESNGRILDISGLVTVILRDMKLQNGTSDLGGSILNNGSDLKLNNVSICNSIANGDLATQGGGAIANISGNVTIRGGVFENNSANGNSGSGGAILNLEMGALTVIESEFINNSANRAGGAIEDNSGDVGTVILRSVNFNGNTTGSNPGNGGALHVTGNGNVDVNGGVVENNVASSEGGGFWNGSGLMLVRGVTFRSNSGNGDGSTNGGGALFNNGGDLRVLDNTVLENNTAMGISGSGGGIFNGNGGKLTICNCTVTGNSASRAGGGLEDNSGSRTVLIKNVDFLNNSTGSNPGNGGAVHITGSGNMKICNSLIANNLANSEGGGLWNGSGTMTVNNTEIRNNVASGDDPTEGGGGLFNNGGKLIVENRSLVINNIANGLSGSGGGIFNESGGMLKVKNSIITGNTANRAGGGIEDNSGSSTTIYLNKVTLSQNTTAANPGNGGGLHVTGPGNVDVRDSEIVNNVASSEGGGLWNGSGTMIINQSNINGNKGNGDESDNGGGGIFNLAGFVRINDSNISNNCSTGASGSGGGILNDNGGRLEINNSTISGNSASRAGGGVEDNSGSSTTIILNNVNLVNNFTGSSPGNGGGLHITGPGNAKITGGRVTNNTAALEGGGLWNGSGLMSVDGVEVSNNTAQGDGSDNGGGGLFNNGGELNICNSVIKDNSATGVSGSGGGIFNESGGKLLIKDSEISGNSASRAGGGVEDNSGSETTITLERVKLNNNVTGANPGNGGGLHITGPGNANIIRGEVIGNNASSEGGGLWNGSGIMSVSKVKISNNTASGDASDQGGGGLFNLSGMMTISNSEISNNVANGASGSGGGILNDSNATLTVVNTTISNNSSSRAGGGIEDNSGGSTLVTLENVNIIGNSTGSSPGNGGGVHITGPGNMDITGGTVQNNTAFAEGGGLWNGSGVMNISRVTIDGNEVTNGGLDQGGGGLFNNGGVMNLDSSTVSANVSNSVGGGLTNDGEFVAIRSTIAFNQSNNGGAIAQLNDGNSTVLTGSILGNNNATTGQSLFGVGNFGSGGWNLVSLDDENLFGALDSDQVGLDNAIDPLLAPLAKNMGKNRTHALLCGSPAINQGNPDDLTNDQRNKPVFGGRRDIGSFELQSNCI